VGYLVFFSGGRLFVFKSINYASEFNHLERIRLSGGTAYLLCSATFSVGNSLHSKFNGVKVRAAEADAQNQQSAFAFQSCLSSWHLILRRAAVSCLRQLSQKEAKEVCEIANKSAAAKSEAEDSKRGVTIGETGEWITVVSLTAYDSEGGSCTFGSVADNTAVSRMITHFPRYSIYSISSF